jgi:hypothetical protein
MRPHALFLLFLFLTPQGGDDAPVTLPLAPNSCPSSRHQDVYPLALRYRQQTYQQIRCAAPRSIAFPSSPPASPRPPDGRSQRERRPVIAENTLYTFMSFQL